MTRKEFIRMCGLLSVGLPLQASFASCTKETISTSFQGKVLIIGAGAAGLSAAYLLNQQGIEFEILEASSVYGGRMKRTTTFADFPIPLGAEWLHVGRNVLDEIVNDSSVNIDIATTFYDSNEDTVLFDGEEVSLDDIDFSEDQKFINSTWFDFFEQYIVPSVQDRIRFGRIVQTIDYTGEQVQVETQSETLTADKVIVTIPLQMLKKGSINFSPTLPDDKLDAINNARVWDGCKAFIEFSEQFYPALTGVDIPDTEGQKLFYDASYGQNTEQHIIGLFAVGTAAQSLIELSDEDVIAALLSELDELFDGKASASYIKHIFQNWNAEPFIEGAYIYDNEDWRRVRTLGESINDKLFFAGTAYTEGNDWGSVHAAARSGRRAVEELVS